MSELRPGITGCTVSVDVDERLCEQCLRCLDLHWRQDPVTTNGIAQKSHADDDNYCPSTCRANCSPTASQHRVPLLFRSVNMLQSLAIRRCETARLRCCNEGTNCSSSSGAESRRNRVNIHRCLGIPDARAERVVGPIACAQLLDAADGALGVAPVAAGRRTAAACTYGSCIVVRDGCQAPVEVGSLAVVTGESACSRAQGDGVGGRVGIPRSIAIAAGRADIAGPVAGCRSRSRVRRRGSGDEHQRHDPAPSVIPVASPWGRGTWRMTLMRRAIWWMLPSHRPSRRVWATIQVLRHQLLMVQTRAASRRTGRRPPRRAAAPVPRARRVRTS